MNDDIVTRLREEADSWCHDSAVRVFLEAADEIEHLREEVAYLKQGWYPTPAVALPYRWWGKEISGE